MTDLSQKTELQTPTGKAQKMLFPCQKTVDKGLGSSKNKVETRFNVGQYKKKRAQTKGMDGG